MVVAVSALFLCSAPDCTSVQCCELKIPGRIKYFGKGHEQDVCSYLTTRGRMKQGGKQRYFPCEMLNYILVVWFLQQDSWQFISKQQISVQHFNTLFRPVIPHVQGKLEMKKHHLPLGLRKRWQIFIKQLNKNKLKFLLQ